MAVSTRAKQIAGDALMKLLKRHLGDDHQVPVQHLARLLKEAGVKTVSKRQLEQAVNAIKHVDQFSRDLEAYMAHTDELTVEQALELLQMSAIRHVDKYRLLDAVTGISTGQQAERDIPHGSEKPEHGDEDLTVQAQYLARSSRGVYDRLREGSRLIETQHEASKTHTYHITEVAPQAIVIHCGDPRFQEAFREFITEELGIASYVPVVLGGGINAVGIQSFLPKNFKVLYGQVKFFVKEAGIKRIIIINHQDCRWYEKMKSYRPTMDVITQGRSDLLQAATEFVEAFADVNVETYYAHLDGKVVTFEKTHD